MIEPPSCHFCPWHWYARPGWPERIDLWRARRAWRRHMLERHSDVLKRYGQ